MHLSEAISKLKNLNNLAKRTKDKTKLNANYVKFAKIAASVTSGKVRNYYLRIIKKHTSSRGSRS